MIAPLRRTAAHGHGQLQAMSLRRGVRAGGVLDAARGASGPSSSAIQLRALGYAVARRGSARGVASSSQVSRLGDSTSSLLSTRTRPSAIAQAIPLQTFRLASSTPPNNASESTSSASTAKDLVKDEDTPSRAVATPSSKSTSALPFHKRAWTTIKKEAAHYWAGTRLLGKEIRISTSLAWKVLNGNVLTRRERRQLRRTTTDILRLIPFSVFILVPFMEILLPVALKLFPNMLPSTFEGKFAAEEKQRKLLRVRIEMAKFLQETVSESGLKAEGVVNSEEFKEFFRKVRSTGESASAEDVIRVAKLFNDDVTLDNLSRPQLVSMCRYMNINAFGTDNFLKHQIRARLEKIRVDDMMIHGEGIDSLSVKELQHACQSRGIRFSGVSPARLREELEQWIDFHYTNHVSGVLLVLSRAFHFDQKGDSVFKSLEATLSSLPDNLLNEAELDVSGDASSYKQKLEVLQQQQELIEDEAEQEQEETEAREQARRDKKEKEERTKREEEAAKAQSMLPANEFAAEKEAVPEADARMTKEQLGELAEALSILSAKSSIVKERDELKQLMEDNIESEEESKLHPEETDSPQTSLNKRIRKMIKKIDAQLETYDEKVGSSLNTIQCNGQGQISLADLKKAFEVIKHRPSDDTVEAVVKKLDVDQDGFVVLDHVVELTQDMGLGIIVDDKAKNILDKGAEIKDQKPRKEDIVAD